MKILRSLLNPSSKSNPQAGTNNNYPRDFSEFDINIHNAVKSFTMTSKERVKVLIDSIRYLCENDIEGDFVECGTWKGGSAMAIALVAQKYNNIRKLWLYDTFEGMSAPTDIDVDLNGQKAEERLEQEKTNKKKSRGWAYSPLEEVKSNIKNTNYPIEKIKFIVGKVEDTLPLNHPETISLLRLDTDWYESTKIELEYLYPKLVYGGILIIDDYGHWQGCKKAVDEYFEKNNIKVFMHRIDYTGRLIVKP